MRLHVRGLGLPDGEPVEWWIVDGTLSAEPVNEAETMFDGGWIVPGLVDAHCHVGLGAHGGVDLDEAIEQAETERDAGALLLRDAGSPIDTRSLDDHDDLPRIIRAGRFLARPKRYQRGFAIELEDESQLPDAAGSSWSATGSTATSAIWRRCGPTTCSKPRSTPPTPRAPGSPRTCSARTRCPGSSMPISTASSTAPG